MVCNSYDAYAGNVAVCISPDLSVEGAYIWVCDDGISMNADEMKALWRVGESTKSRTADLDGRRLQIGRFGIGKLSTYILAHELTYICKKDNRYLAVKMDYGKITQNSGENLTLDEIELEEDDVKTLLNRYIRNYNLIPFELIGKKSIPTWTFSIMTNLKPKAMEISEGRLKWILQTALPLNPNFKLYYNGSYLESSKIKIPILKEWTIGQDDDTASRIGANIYEDDDVFYIDLPNLNRVHGKCFLYEDSLVNGKAAGLGRSHGIFLMVRNRLINIDDPLLGMEAFSHGAFNRTRIVVYADGLDENIASTREVIKESLPFTQLKTYIKKKFNNEIKRFYFDKEMETARNSSISYRLSQTSTSLSKTPLITFARKFFNNEISNPLLLILPSISKEKQTEFLTKLEEDIDNNSVFVGNSSWENLSAEAPIAKFDIAERKLKINLMHPFIANYSDEFKSKLPIEFIAMTEVLTEAHLYEISVPEESVFSILTRRDRVLRELVFGDRMSAPLVAQIVKDALGNPDGLEHAVTQAFLALGFEANSIGGNGEPDGFAQAILGYSEDSKCENYSITYDAKSTAKTRIQAATARLSALNRHKTSYKADFSVVVAIDFEGAETEDSAINIETKQQQITAIRARDLMKLLLLSVPKQIGLKKLKTLFENCYTPNEVSSWISEIENQKVERGPINEILETIYGLQKDDSEPPELASIRVELKHRNIIISIVQLTELINSLKVLVPNYVNVENKRISINSKPDIIKQAIQNATTDVPSEFQQLYIDALCAK